MDGDELAPWLAPLMALAAEVGSTVAHVYAFFAVLSVLPADPFPAEMRLGKACALV